MEDKEPQESAFPVTTLLRGRTAERFREFKRSENLYSDAEVARKLIADQLDAVFADGPTHLFQRKPMQKAEARELVRDVLREALENVG